MNVSHIDVNADWDTAKPIEAGIGRNSHFEVIVKFTDGSRFRTALGSVRYGRKKWSGRKYVEYSYDEDDLKDAISLAKEEHFSAALRGPEQERERQVKRILEKIRFAFFGSAIYPLLLLGVFAGVFLLGMLFGHING